MVPRLISVVALPSYQLRLRFEDGTNGLLDISSLSGRGVFQAWDDNCLFFRPYINEMGTVAWSEFIDIDLLNAYLALKNITFEEWKQRTLTHASD